MATTPLVIIAGSKTDYLAYIKKVGLTEEETDYTEDLGDLLFYKRHYYILGKNWGNYIHVKGSPFNCSFKSQNYRVFSIKEWRDRC